jgi:hypothetical protein
MFPAAAEADRKRRCRPNTEPPLVSLPSLCESPSARPRISPRQTAHDFASSCLCQRLHRHRRQLPIRPCRVRAICDVLSTSPLVLSRSRGSPDVCILGLASRLARLFCSLTSPLALAAPGLTRMNTRGYDSRALNCGHGYARLFGELLGEHIRQTLRPRCWWWEVAMGRISGTQPEGSAKDMSFPCLLLSVPMLWRPDSLRDVSGHLHWIC